MQGLGEGIFRFFFFSIPGMILVALIFPIQLPYNPVSWGYIRYIIVVKLCY